MNSVKAINEMLESPAFELDYRNAKILRAEKIRVVSFQFPTWAKKAAKLKNLSITRLSYDTLLDIRELMETKDRNYIVKKWSESINAPSETTKCYAIYSGEDLHYINIRLGGFPIFYMYMLEILWTHKTEAPDTRKRIRPRGLKYHQDPNRLGRRSFKIGPDLQTGLQLAGLTIEDALRRALELYDYTPVDKYRAKAFSLRDYPSTSAQLLPGEWAQIKIFFGNPCDAVAFVLKKV